MLTTIIARQAIRSKTATRRLPSCFDDHHAPPSVVELFSRWVEQADAADNGIVVINRQHQPYSDTAVDRAIRWLKAHRLLKRVERDCTTGRGNAVAYFVRWSFEHPNPFSRQIAVNHPKPSERVNPVPHRRKTYRGTSFLKRKTGRKPVSHSGKPSQLKGKSSERAIRWGLARARSSLRDHLAAEEFDERRYLLAVYLDALAVTFRRVLGSGEVRAGPEFGVFVDEVLTEIKWEFRWDTSARSVFSLVAHIAQVALTEVHRVRREREEAWQRRREREEAAEHPINELLETEGVGHVSELIRRTIAERTSGVKRAHTSKFVRKLTEADCIQPAGYKRIKQERMEIARGFQGVKSWRDFLPEDAEDRPTDERPKRSIHRAHRITSKRLYTDDSAQTWGAGNIGDLVGAFVEKLKLEAGREN